MEKIVNYKKGWTVDDEYMKLVSLFDDLIEDEKNIRPDRTGVGTYSLFSPGKFSIDACIVFPLLSVKKINFSHIVHEIIWYIKGNTNVKYLEDNGIKIWSDWKDENGELGPIYGKQWRRFEGPNGEVDQLKNVIDILKNDPFSRRNLLLGYNPADKPTKAPQGCHTLAQFYVDEDKYGIKEVSVQVYQRSGDLMLGIPYDIAMYGLVLELICKELNFGNPDEDYIPGKLHFVFGDLHIYANHLEGLTKLKKQYVEFSNMMDKGLYPKQYITFENYNGIENFDISQIKLNDYNPMSFIKFPIAV